MKIRLRSVSDDLGRMGGRGDMDRNERHPIACRPRLAAPRWLACVAAFGLLLAACGNNATAPPSGTRSPVSSLAPSASTGAGLPTPEPKEVTAVPVVSCPTSYASPGATRPPIATTQTATITSSVAASVTFYSDGDLTILGPKGWQCAATVAADGSGRMAITPAGRPWPTGSATPPPDLQAVTAVSAGACIDCVARLACALFPEAGRLLAAACPATLATQEIIRRPFPRSATFVDPPGVTGTGEPSGGQYRAQGLLVFSPGEPAGGGGSLQPSALKVTCTLEVSMAPICDEIVEHG
jgi:hypothetical protein